MTSPSSTKTRLHITPFNLELLPLVLPPSIRPSATEISFHHIPTFPENNYGYVTLPTMEADKIKKKLNGSILKGRKFKVDTARPQKEGQREEEDAQGISTNQKTPEKKSKKRKAADNILDGYELPSDRKVKRGWTESTNDKGERRKKEKKQKGKEEGKAKSQAKSKYTEKAECLFRTRIPPNKSSSVDEKSGKQSKKKDKKSAESVVHEFSQTITQPSFLRSEDVGVAPTYEFEEGKGWVDGSGQLKEKASDRIRKPRFRPGEVEGHKEKPRSRKSSSKTEHDASQKSKGRVTEPNEEKDSTDVEEDWTSSSGSSSSEEEASDSEISESQSTDEEESSDLASKEEKSQTSHQHPEEGDSGNSSPVSDVATNQADSHQSNNQPQEIHPLEALFKRPAPVASGEKSHSEGPAQFSFFGQEDIESEEETREAPEPLTPFTKRDLHGRGLRSAAPTPDTTQVGRTINWKLSDGFDATIAETSPSVNTPVPKTATALNDESEFTKWFWENRGDNNRAWKRRRREVAKEQRQRENRRKNMKGKS